MGRGATKNQAQQNSSSAMRRGQKEHHETRQLDIRIDDVWVSPQGREVTIINAYQPWAHLCLVVKDRFGIFFIEPKILTKKYSLKNRNEKSTSLSLEKEEFVRTAANKPQEVFQPMTKPQEGYLQRLSADAGIVFNARLSKQEASAEINRLKKLLKR